MMRSFVITFAAIATFAAPAAAQAPVPRMFANINFGYQAQDQDFRQAAEFPLYEEIGNWQAEHSLEGGGLFDIGAGYRVRRNLSVGLSYTVRTTQDRDVAVTASVPHPVFFDTFRSATATATGLEHREQAVHLQALWHVPVTVEFDATLFGGPTIFTVRDTLIADVTPVERGGDLSTVDLQMGTAGQRETTVGFHLGLDTRYMFTRNIGAGAMLRYSRGTVTLTNTAATPANGEFELDAGGLEIGVGLRFRF